MTRRSLFTATVAVAGLAAGATLALGPASAAKPPQPPGPPVVKAEPVTIYSDSFSPFSRMPDGDSVNDVRYYTPGPDGFYGPGASPHSFIRVAGTGHDAFFNSPDLTIGSTPMSATSAEVCMEVKNRLDTGEVLADVLVGVQDLDRNFALATDDQGAYVHTVVPGDPTCLTMTFDPAVQLVNHPHLVTVLDLHLRGVDPEDSWAEVDGVAYHVRPTATGDVVPTPLPAVAELQDLLPQR